MEAWNSKGLGWQSEILEDSKLEGYKKTINYYYLACVYDAREMSLLLEEIVGQAKELGIYILFIITLLSLLSIIVCVFLVSSGGLCAVFRFLYSFLIYPRFSIF